MRTGCVDVCTWVNELCWILLIVCECMGQYKLNSVCLAHKMFNVEQQGNEKQSGEDIQLARHYIEY